MPPKSLLAYAEVREALDQALDSERGVRIPCHTPGAAYNLRQKFYKFRSLDREQNARIYEEGAPMWGKSVYDTLVFEALDASGARMHSKNAKAWKEGTAYVVVTKNESNRLEIEVL